MAQPEDLLDEIESEHQQDAEALATLALAVNEINALIDEDGATMDRKERIRKLVERLHGVVSDVAKRSKAHGFTISIGLPARVSVSLDWEVGNRKPWER